MPKLIIDDRPIEVPPGTKVIEAAERLGIMIPRFCYHAALGAVGACRVCAVMFLDGPVKGLQMSCMVDAQDDMKVSTTHAHAVDFRRQVIEWLMLHHPHDCPVCDEGGHCLLQDHTESSGHAIRRYRGRKRTYRDQYLGPLLQHEMNRCIQCYRCSRYYQEFSGYRDLTVMQIANKVYFGRQRDGILQSPFAGNLADICPTGVFTDKPSRYMGRRWEYDRTPSVCINCSLGCNIVVSARYREVVRLEARFSPTVNGWFICDRGRHGYTYTSAPDRPRSARLDGREVTPEVALQEADQRLTTIGQSQGVDRVACIGSLRSSLETQGALVRLCRSKGWPLPVFFDDADRLAAVQCAVAQRRTDLHISMRQIENADAVLVVGCDPTAEAPMLTLALRQAQRQGAAIVCVDPRPIDLPLTFTHVPVARHAIAPWLAELTRKIVPPSDAKPEEGAKRSGPQDDLTKTARLLSGSRRPVIVCGTDVIGATVIDRAGALACALNHDQRKTGVFNVLPGAGAFSAALLGASERSVEEVTAGISRGEIKALLVVETDPLWHCSDRRGLTEALKRLEVLVVMDCLEGAHTRAAHIFLPAGTLFESGGTFVNQEGRAQAASSAYAGGIPIRISGGGDHPQRVYGLGIPGAQTLPAAQMLSSWTGEAGKDAPAEILMWLSGAFPALGPLSTAARPDGGLLLTDGGPADFTEGQRKDGSVVDPEPAAPDSLDLLTVEQTFGSEELSCRSPQLLELEPLPMAFLSSGDADRLDLRDGDTIVIDAQDGAIEISLAVRGNMAAGTLVLPRHHRLAWQRLGRRHIRLPAGRIRKKEAREGSKE